MPNILCIHPEPPHHCRCRLLKPLKERDADDGGGGNSGDEDGDTGSNNGSSGIAGGGQQGAVLVAERTLNRQILDMVVASGEALAPLLASTKDNNVQGADSHSVCFKVVEVMIYPGAVLLGCFSDQRKYAENQQEAAS